MKIEKVDVWLVEGIKYNWTLLRITTDSGLTGVGEATNWPGSPLVYHAAKHLGDRIIGLDPSRIDYIWSKLYRDLNWLGPTGVMMCAMSGIDMALLDLKAKSLGIPCYELLGGAFRKKILLYANYWFIKGGHNPEDYVWQAKEVVAQGFTGLKFDPFAHTNYLFGDDLSSNLTLTSAQEDLAYDIVRAVRETVGPDVQIAIETHAMLSMPTALRMAERLAPLNMMWYEEPVGPESANTLKYFRERTNVPICVGERHYSRWGFRPVLEQQLVDYIMPDVTRCGGPSELKRIATMAETYNIQVAPHNPNGPLSTLASAHVCASIPNFFRQEFMFTDVPWRDTVISRALNIKDGFYILDDTPGLGVDLVDEVMEAHPGITEMKPGFYV
ncbi:MAG: mandelate racemase/muconate lactonizing enzyme family protein [Anaerolineae bacterium]|nr:mandelate racemase/muconate lactonizing enzyme family protein [Anaerolineae bacterium]